LGEGTVGTVSSAVGVHGGEFAVKEVNRNLARDPAVRARFVRDYDRFVSLRHPNLVSVHDLVVEGSTIAIVMDLVRGGDLRTRLEDQGGAFLPAEVARIGAGVAAALAEVHALEIGHGNVRPENVLMDDATGSPTPRLTDFGISWLSGSFDFGARAQYLAPEFSSGAEATPASDVYSLGIVLYELTCGVPPFVGIPPGDRRDWRPGCPAGLDPDLWHLLNAMLATRPADRPSAADVAEALSELEVRLIGTPVVGPMSQPPRPVMPEVPSAPPSSGGFVSRKRRVVLVPIVVAAVLAGGWLVFRPGTDASGTDPQSAPTSAPVATSSQPTAITTTSTLAPVPTVAPNLIGKKLADAQSSAPLKLVSENVIDESKTPGTVVDQDPKPGEPLSGQLKVFVAQKAAQFYLASFKPASGAWNDSDKVAHVAGVEYVHSVGANVSACSETKVVEYNTAKKYRRLKATAGMDDDSADATLTVQLQVFADDRVVFDQRVEFGKPAPIDVDLSGVLRVKFQWRPITARNCPTPNALVLGDAMVLGLPSEVPTSSTTPTS
jgi:serine/threonine-protein kinase